ncbi:Hypothetical protein, partial CDS, partial [Neorhizobium galegae bv. orientalis]
ERFHHTVPASRCDGSLFGKGCVCRGLGIEIIIFAPSSTVVTIWCGHLEDLHTRVCMYRGSPAP